MARGARVRGGSCTAAPLGIAAEASVAVQPQPPNGPAKTEIAQIPAFQPHNSSVLGVGQQTRRFPISRRPVGFPKEQPSSRWQPKAPVPFAPGPFWDNGFSMNELPSRTARRSRGIPGAPTVGGSPLPYRLPFTMRRPGFKPAFWSTTGRRNRREDKRTARCVSWDVSNRQDEHHRRLGENRNASTGGRR